MEQGKLDFDKIDHRVTKAFAEAGVVCLRGVLDTQWIDYLREAVEDAIANPGPMAGKNKSEGFITETQMWIHHESFRRFAMESPIAGIAAMVMGSSAVQMYNDTLFVKEPATPEPTPWHHDQPYFNLGGMQNCSVWIGLDPVTSQSGAMSFVPGSHKWGKMYYPVEFGQDGGNAITRESFDGPPPDIDAAPTDYEVISFDLSPGDVTFHHLRTLHKAGPNSTRTTRRRAHTIRMVGDDATFVERPFSTAKFDVDLNSGDKLEGRPFPYLWRRTLEKAPDA